MNTDCKSIRKKTQACDAQAQILAAVDELFYLEGARAVGVEAVVKRAGVNKMSLYRQFESKDALLLEYLKRRNEKYWMLVQASLDKHPDNARKQLQQLFMDFAERSAECTYRGCAFVNIAVEFPDPNHAARLLVAENKKQLLNKLNELAVKAGARDAQLMASALALLLEGAYTATQTYAADSGLVKQVPAIAAAMIADFCD